MSEGEPTQKITRLRYDLMRRGYTAIPSVLLMAEGALWIGRASIKGIRGSLRLGIRQISKRL